MCLSQAVSQLAQGGGAAASLMGDDMFAVALLIACFIQGNNVGEERMSIPKKH